MSELLELQSLAQRAATRGGATIDEVEAGIRRADVLAETRLGFDLRFSLIWMCLGPRPDLILTHYPWCLAHLDVADDARRHRILFRYRWAISQAIDYPSIPRSRVEELVEDMSQRYCELGYLQRSGWVLRLLLGYRLWRDQTLVRTAIAECSMHEPLCAIRARVVELG